MKSLSPVKSLLLAPPPSPRRPKPQPLMPGGAPLPAAAPPAPFGANGPEAHDPARADRTERRSTRRRRGHY